MSNFHPSIADLIPVDLIPGDLPLEQTINSLLQKIYYEDLILSKNRDNTAGYYAMTLVLYTRLGIPLPAGLALVVNPSIDTNTNTEIPLEFSYTWAVIKYIADFNPTSFGETPAEFFELFLNILDLSEEAFLTRLLDGFIGGSDPIQDVIDAVNNDASNSITLTRNNTIVDREALIADLVRQITSSTLPSGTDFFSIFYGLFLAGTNTLDNIATFFGKWFGEIDFDAIIKRLIPQFKLLLPNIDVALEFPENVLRRVDPITREPLLDTNQQPLKSLLLFNVGALEFSSQYGFSSRLESSFDLAPSEIGQTGLILTIDDAQVDIGDYQNTLPNTSSYPTTFKGIHIEEIVIGLPSFWNKDNPQGNGGIDIFGENLLIGGYKEEATGNDKTVFEGTVGLRDTTGVNTTPTLTTTLPGDLELSLTRFDITFANGGIAQSTLQGQLSIPGGDNGPHVVVITGQYKDNGFSLSAQGAGAAPLLSIPLGDFGELYLSELTIGAENGAFFLSLKAGLKYVTDFPMVDKFLPNPLLLEEFKVSKNGIEEFALNVKWDEIGENFVQSLSGESEQVIPLGWNLFDVLFINALKLKTALNVDVNGGTSSFASQALIDGALELGPLYVSVGDVGAELKIEYVEDPSLPTAPNNAAYLGPLAITGAFIPPSKIGLLIDAEKLTGGGAVWLDYENQRYSGALQLNIADTLNLSAIGIIAFKAPDGSKQFSFLAVVTVEFPPTHLAYGFWLTGAGGILGLNRGMNPEVLRQGVKTGIFDDILFPTNPVENFERIVTGLDAAFPITQGQFIIGPMLQIGWGGQNEKAQLFQLEIGLIIELPKPIRIALPGVLKTLLPKADSDVITIKAAFIAILDFGAKLFSLDASLYDSHILKKFTLSGDIAMRLSWGNQPVFVLSVGGFHPEYTQVPKGLTNMRRMTLSILDEPQASVKLEAYLAITSNSVQVGARVDLRFAAGKKGHVQVIGYVYFDALFQFNPFLMIIEVGAGVSVEFFGVPILAIHLLFRLEGPSPWRVKGHATFAIVGIEFKVPFDETFGERKITTVEETDLMPLIKEALELPDAWRSIAPQRRATHELVTLKATVGQEEGLLLQPYGRLSIQQSIAPLETTLEKYGERGLVNGEQYYTINNLYVVQGSNQVFLDKQSVEEEFARAQYEALGEQEKLRVPAFEKFPAGVQLSDHVLPIQVSDKEELTPVYEMIIIEANDELEEGVFVTYSHTQDPVIPSEEEFEALLGNHAVANSTLSISATTTKQGVQRKAPSFYIVSKANLQPYEPAHLTVPNGYSRTRADQWLRELYQTDPSTAILLQVLAASELVLVDTTSINSPSSIDQTILITRQQLISL